MALCSGRVFIDSVSVVGCCLVFREEHFVCLDLLCVWSFLCLMVYFSV